MSSCYTTVTASVVQIAATGALGKMLDSLKSREVDVFASSYFTTKPFAHGFERSAHEEQIYASKKNASIKSKFEISRAFDLVHQLYIVIDLPGIANVVDGDKIAAAKASGGDTEANTGAMPYYCNGVGPAGPTTLPSSAGSARSRAAFRSAPAPANFRTKPCEQKHDVITITHTTSV